MSLLNHKTEIKEEKVMTYENAGGILKGRQKVLKFPIGKKAQGKWIKVLTPK